MKDLEFAEFTVQYGKLVESFDNGDIVIATFPHGCEIAVTKPGRQFPIRTIVNPDGTNWVGTRQEASDRADKIVRHLLCEYGTTLPDHVAVR